MPRITISTFEQAKHVILAYQATLQQIAEALRKETKAEVCGEEYHPEWVQDLLLKIEAMGG